MRINKIIYAMLVALSASPVAFAQYIGSAHGQAQTTSNADSTTPINAMAGVVQAPKSNIGSGDASGSAAASQTYETKLEPCPIGTTGYQEMTRKIYIRQNGSRYEEAWVMKGGACIPIKDPAIQALDDKFTALFNVIGGRVDQLEQRPTSGAQGAVATPFFTVMTSTNGGSTTASNERFVCIYGISSTIGDYLTFYPEARTYRPGTPGNPIYWAYKGAPYAGWQGTGQDSGYSFGPICPTGSTLQSTIARQPATPDTP